MTYRNCQLVVAFGLLIAIGIQNAVAEPHEFPQRQTADWQADLITSLVAAEMLATAESICERHLQDSDAGKDEAARWAIRLSAVRSANILTQAIVDAEVVAAARQPIEGILQAYPQHPRAVWLNTQLALVDLAVVRQAAVGLAITPGDARLQDRGIRSVTTLLGQLETLSEELAASPEANDPNIQALRQAVEQHHVEALLWRGRLFASGSENAIASAAEAERAARDLLSRLPGGTRVHRDTTLLRTEALIETGHPDQAIQVLNDLERAGNGVLSPASQALRIRAALAQQDPDAAGKLLNNYYAEDPAQAPPSEEMDLARLMWLLNTAKGDARDERLREIADWLDAMERRGGAYARRRGEAETLQVVRLPTTGGDTRLMAAEAARQLRAGKLREAGELLAQAAASTSDPTLALRYAAQSAAVLKNAGRLAQAAEVLTETAATHSQEASAASLHLQAAWLIAEMMKQDGDADTMTLEAILQTTAERWPGAKERTTAADWLVRLYVASGRDADAARWTLLHHPMPSVETIRRAGELWQVALRRQPNDDALRNEAMKALANVGNQHAEVAAQQQDRLAALYAPRRELSPPHAADHVSTSDPFIHSLLEFRRGGNSLVVPPQHGSRWKYTAIDAIARLYLDGQQTPADRDRLASGILTISETLDDALTDGGLLSARALAWAGRWKEADKIYQQTIENNPGDLASVRRAATELSESPSPEAKRRVIFYWSKIAGGVAQGSEPWHDAKLATIGLHLSVQESAEAARLCRFILLTRPPQDAERKQAYETLLKQCSY